MGGKSSQSTQQIQIPPEVLARYNAVNARAETVADRPFQQYSTDPNAFVAPLTPTQQAGIANTNYYAGTAQPYYAAATQQLMGAQNTATPFYGQAAQQVGQAQDVGQRLAGLSMQSLYGGQNAAAGLQGQAASGLTSAYNQAQPFNAAAVGQYEQGAQQGRGLTGLAAAGTQQAFAGAQPFQQAAAQYMGAGAQAVNPGALGAQQINQYMSPYLANVLQGTAALQNQMNQQAMAGQTGNAIRQGAFGGDRAGIAAANLAQQQQLASSKTFADILNQGYGQALSTAQQQQGLGLSAEQANRAAQQQAAQQALAIGQQGFGQGLSAAQQQAALGQQLYGMGSGTGQNLAALGQQLYGQGTGTAQQQAALAQQLYNQGLGTSQQVANLGQQQFGQGLSAAQQNAALGAGLYGMGSQTAQGLANLGLGSQSAGLQGAQAQMAAGQAQQQTQQAGLQALYNQFLQGQSYPFQVAQFLANIAMGTGALSGSTTQTNQAMGGFSDRRLKENVKPIGKTFDGQTIYSYNFKGEPQTEIGLIAQEVEKHHPEAVGLAGGYKTVRYDKATEDAADRGHFAAGGAAMGGGVMPYHAGEGFFDGGAVGYDPAIMQQILSAYERMYAPLQGAKGGLGAASFVPESNLPVGQLMTAGDLPAAPSAIEGVQGMVNLGTGLGELGGNLGAWDYTDAQRAATERKKREKGTTPDETETKAYGGLAGGRRAYENGGPTDEIVVEGRRQQQAAPAQPPKKIEVPSATPEAAKLAPVANVDTSKTMEKPAFQKVGLDIPQIGNRVGMAVAPGLDSLKDSTGEVLQGIGSIAAAFSDKRLKENLKAVGKTFDGQTVYSYNYKGDPQTRMGLIAQEVEKHHPQAVGHVGGYKTVNYKQATGLAAKRGHFAMGGETDDSQNYMAPGINIPMQGAATGLAAAPGLSQLKDSTGDILGGIGSIAQAGKDIFGKKKDEAEKAEGGALGGLGALEFKHEGLDPEFGIDPEDLVSGEDENFEYLMRNRGMPVDEEARPSGLAAFEKGAQGVREMLSEERKRPTGLAPSFARESAPLSSDLGAIAKMIRGHEGMGKNPMSSATGPYQMIDSTFVNYFRKMYPDQAQGKSDREILSIRRSPAGISISEQIGPQIIRDNARTLATRGFEPNARNVYLAHFFGPETAIKVLSANPNTPIERIVGQEAVNANPFLRGRDAMGALRFAEQAMAKQQRLLSAPGKAEGGGLAGRPHKQLGGTFEDEFDATFGKPKPTGLAAAEAPAQPPENVDTQDIIVNAKKPPVLAPKPELPEFAGVRPTSFGRGEKQKPATYEGGNIPSYSYDYMTEPFFKGLKSGSAQSWIPLLTGLGTFATMPTRSMLSGLLGGVGAGAQTYANLANERNKQLPTRQAAMAQFGTAMRGFIEKDFQPLGNGKWYYVPTGETLTQDQYYALRARMQSPNTVTPFMAPQGIGGQYDPSKDSGFRAPKEPPALPNIQPDMNTVGGIYASAFADPTIVSARQRKAAAQTTIEDGTKLLQDPQILSSSAKVEGIRSAVANAQVELASATKDYDTRVAQLTDVPLQNLSATQRAAFENTMEKAYKLEADKSAMRPLMQQFAALKGNFEGGTAQGAWARVADFVANFGNLSDEQKKLVANGSDANSRQAIMEILGGPMFDPNMPGDALKWVYDNYVKPRYQDIDSQIKSLKPYTAPTGAPQSSVGVSPSITPPPVTPPARAQGAQVVLGRDGIWRGASEEAIQADNRIKPGTRYRIPDGKGGFIEGVK